MRYFDQSVNPEALLRDLQDSDPQVRSLAADAISRVEEQHRPRACEVLRTLLQDEHSQIRYTAALSLGELGDEQAIEALIEQVEGDGNAMARQAAVIALGMIGDARAAPYLIKALNSDNPDVRFQAVTSLMQVNPEQAAKPLRRALKDEDPEVRAGAVAALGDLGDPLCVASIAPMLDDLTSGGAVRGRHDPRTARGSPGHGAAAETHSSARRPCSWPPSISTAAPILGPSIR